MTAPTRFSLVCCVLLIGMLAVPCQSAKAQDATVRQTKEVASFTEIGFAAPGTVHLRQGEPQSVEVEGTENTLNKLEIEVEEGTLHIRTEGSGSWLDWFGLGTDTPQEQIDVYVTVPTITGLSIAGSGDIVGDTRIEGTTIELRNAGSGQFDLDVEAEEVQVQIAGSGTTRLRGRAATLTAEIAGSGGVEGEALETEAADISIAGSGNVHLTVTDRLSAQVMGSGNVRYRGTPSVDSNVVGSGTVKAIE